HCTHCCVGLMAILLVIGVMDLRAMAVVAAAITVERLAPAGERVARAIGAVVFGAAAVTVSVVLPETPPKVAVIVVVPAATDVAKPCDPPALLIVDTAVLDELQVTWVVRSCVVKSL